jgi:hypothetical protein
MPLLRVDRSRRRLFVSCADTLRGRRGDTVHLRHPVPQSCSDVVRDCHQFEEIAQCVARPILCLIILRRRRLLREVRSRSLHAA